MSRERRVVAGNEEWVRGLDELLEAGRACITAYGAAETRVRDHRVQEAITRLRLDHERHVAELAELRQELVEEAPAAGASPAPRPRERSHPVITVLGRGDVSGPAVLGAVRSAEEALHRLYDAHVERGYMEPIRTALVRHRREEAAHLAFVHEGEFWGRVEDERERATGDDAAPFPAARRRRAPGNRAAHGGDRTDDGEDRLSDERLAGTG